jgi:hypothetical protein
MSATQVYDKNVDNTYGWLPTGEGQQRHCCPNQEEAQQLHIDPECCWLQSEKAVATRAGGALRVPVW